MLAAKSFHAESRVWSVEICKRIYKKERKFDFMAEKTVKLEDPANNRMGSAKMLPLILTSLNRIDTISNAMELRGFGKSDKRTWYTRRPFDRRDFIALGFGAVLLLISLAVTIM